MNPQIQALLEKAVQSLNAALLLAENGYFDFAASRAYYTMFYVAEALLLQRGLSFSSHAAVIAAYGKEFAKTEELNPQFHKYLIAVQDFRSQGDYDLAPGVSVENTRNLLAWAKEFLAAATAYLAIQL